MRHPKHISKIRKVQLRTSFLFCCFLFSVGILSAQKRVAITIDDLPNTANYEADRFEPILLNKLDELNIPVTAFINEGQLTKTTANSENFDLFLEWCERPNVTLGNHTRDHVRYSEVGLDAFCKNIESGEVSTRSIADRFGKPLVYFRFPYNDLGTDAKQRAQIETYLAAHDYIVAPFTIESSDWMFNVVYRHYLAEGEQEKAEAIGEAYVLKTLALFEFYDSLSLDLYKRDVDQIYLCHDNAINADYLDVLVKALTKRNYAIISMEEAMKDEIYHQENVYNKKWGISWMYRWMKDPADRMRIMRAEPSLTEIEADYQMVVSKKK